MPALSAASFPRELAVFLPRPRGRSGCVTTAATWKYESASKARREGTAKAGVPQNTSFSGTGALPLACFFHFANFALDHVALQHSEMHDEKRPIQMIDLVAERAGEQSFAAHFEFSAGSVLRAHRDVLWPRHVASESRKRETAFLFALFALGVNDFRIGTDELGFGVFSIRDINYCDPQSNSDLRRREAPTRCCVHGLEHVRDELLDLVVEFFDSLCRRFQHRVAIFHNRMNHLE